jgi:protein-S-isoprenylcysteine O-methyltransferase Ste14
VIPNAIRLGTVWLFPVSEIALALLRRADARHSRRDDRGSMLIIWAAVGLGLACAMACRSISAAGIRLPGVLVRTLAMGILVAGMAIRWAAIITLGRHFTVDVAVRPDHALVQHGLYNSVRHPSYSGLLLAFLGLGLLFGNWLSLASLVLPTTCAVWNRIGVEERALRAALGSEYAGYCARTKRLVPGVI